MEELVIEKRGNHFLVNGEERESLAGLFGLGEEHANKLRIVEEHFETLNIKRLVVKEDGGKVYIFIDF